VVRVKRELALWLLGAAWLCGIAGAFAAWESYDATPGAVAGDARSAAPVRPGERWSLVLFAHPHCPCTRAGLAELREILAEAPGPIDVRVLFVRPGGVGEGWERGELWDAAAAIPGLRVECDPEGAEARRAGASVSGHVLAYEPGGRLAFRGGITKARGRAGDNPGRRAVVAALRGSAADREGPVFGCPLFAPGACCTKEPASCQR
jgi:hypothetical protein